MCCFDFLTANVPTITMSKVADMQPIYVDGLIVSCALGVAFRYIDTLRFHRSPALKSDQNQRLGMLQYLEWREKQYDQRHRVDVFGRDPNAAPVVKGGC